MTTTRVKVSDIVVTRDQEPEPLPDGLPKKAYEQPIIIRGDMVLIDGLRRLRRAQAKGLEEVPAIVSSDFLTLIQALREQNADSGNTVPHRRVWEVYDLISLLGISWSRNQFNGGWDRLPNGKRARRTEASEPGSGSVRQRFVEAFDYSDSTVSHILTVYRRAQNGYPLAQGLVEKVEAGQLGINRAAHLLRNPHNMTGNILDVEEQRKILQRGSVGLAAQVDALVRLGYPIKVPANELEEHFKRIYAARTKITELLNGLRQVLKEAEVNNG